MNNMLVLNYGKKTGRLPPEPDDCPECKGAKGFEQQSGDMGGVKIVPCAMCNGRGKLSQGEVEIHAIMAIHTKFKNAMVPKYAQIVAAACKWVRAKREYRDLLDTSMMPPSDYYTAISEATNRQRTGKADLIRLVEELDALEAEYGKMLGKDPVSKTAPARTTEP